MTEDRKPVMISLHPKWLNLILNGQKTREVRKRAPLQKHPYKVYLYCTKPNTKDPYEIIEIHNHKDGKIYKANGFVVGEATCVSTTDYTRPFGNCTYGTCLTARELYEYAGTKDKLSYMALENPIIYDVPKTLSEFGMNRPPQSWCYIKEKEL